MGSGAEVVIFYCIRLLFAEAGLSVKPKIVLTIAGFDPSSGAGITADLKTIHAHAMYGIAAITAHTVQNTVAVQRVEAVDARLLRDTVTALTTDFVIDAVKVGVLATVEIVETVAALLQEHRLQNIVLDPVLESSSGATLLFHDALQSFKERLLPLASVVTPNPKEALGLTGAQTIEAAGARLLEFGAKCVVITNGEAAEPTDVLMLPGMSPELLRGEHVETTSTHGTGCAFSAAIACGLAAGQGVREAVLRAKAYVNGALRHAPGLGKGRGPLAHFWEANL